MREDMFGGHFFSGISRENAEVIIGACSAKACTAGENIFSEGDPGDSIWIVERGSVEVFKTITGDIDRVLDTFRVGDIFGEMTFLDGRPRSASARAMEDSSLLYLSRPAFNNIAISNHSVSEACFERLAVIMAERLRLTIESYKESVLAFLEASGAASLGLHHLAESFSVVAVGLSNGSTVAGRIVSLDRQPPGWALLIKNEKGTISLIPYHSIVSIDVR